jgi:hypothetical protein
VTCIRGSLNNKNAEERVWLNLKQTLLLAEQFRCNNSLFPILQLLRLFRIQYMSDFVNESANIYSEMVTFDAVP